MDQPKILVAIRKRPLSEKETRKGDTDIISVKNQNTLLVSEIKTKVDLTKYIQQTVFNFDFAFAEADSNATIYHEAVQPLIDSAFLGAKVTCFAYGQTGSGKTFTMNGSMKSKEKIKGLYTYGAEDIFLYLEQPKFAHLTARISFYEIYCGKIFDLLNKREQLKIREDKNSNIHIVGLKQIDIHSCEQFDQYLEYGTSQRVTSQNSANTESSRSHAILQISLKQGKKLFSKISFIDLAGNQRGADHMNMGKQTRVDGAEINKSLLSLKQCIRALDQGKGHTPFRGSKLTMVLKDSFIGFCRTIMIGNVSPSSASSQNTFNTLRYADRVKELRKPSDGTSKQDKKLNEMMLPRGANKNCVKISIQDGEDAEDIAKKREDVHRSIGFKVEEPLFNRAPSAKSFKQNQNQAPKQQIGFPKQGTKNLEPSISRAKSTKGLKNIKTFNSYEEMDVQSFDHENLFSRRTNGNLSMMNQTKKVEAPSPKKLIKKVQEPIPIKGLQTATTELPIEKNENPNRIDGKWVQMVDFCLANPKSSQSKIYRDKLRNQLLSQQQILRENHRKGLFQEAEYIKQQMQALQKAPQEENRVEYLSYLTQSIEQKINSLELLRQNLIEFRYKTDEYQQVDKEMAAQEKEAQQFMEDEQLLDGFN